MYNMQPNAELFPENTFLFSILPSDQEPDAWQIEIASREATLNFVPETTQEPFVFYRNDSAFGTIKCILWLDSSFSLDIKMKHVAFGLAKCGFELLLLAAGDETANPHEFGNDDLIESLLSDIYEASENMKYELLSLGIPYDVDTKKVEFSCGIIRANGFYGAHSIDVLDVPSWWTQNRIVAALRRWTLRENKRSIDIDYINDEHYYYRYREIGRDDQVSASPFARDIDSWHFYYRDHKYPKFKGCNHVLHLEIYHYPSGHHIDTLTMAISSPHVYERCFRRFVQYCWNFGLNLSTHSFRVISLA